MVIYDLNESGDLGALSVLGITLLAVSFTVVAIANRLPRRRSAAARPAAPIIDVSHFEGLTGSGVRTDSVSVQGENR